VAREVGDRNHGLCHPALWRDRQQLQILPARRPQGTRNINENESAPGAILPAHQTLELNPTRTVVSEIREMVELRDVSHDGERGGILPARPKRNPSQTTHQPTWPYSQPGHIPKAPLQSGDCSLSYSAGIDNLKQ